MRTLFALALVALLASPLAAHATDLNAVQLSGAVLDWEVKPAADGTPRVLLRLLTNGSPVTVVCGSQTAMHCASTREMDRVIVEGRLLGAQVRVVAIHLPETTE